MLVVPSPVPLVGPEPSGSPWREQSPAATPTFSIQPYSPNTNTNTSPTKVIHEDGEEEWVQEEELGRLRGVRSLLRGAVLRPLGAVSRSLSKRAQQVGKVVKFLLTDD